MTRRDLLKLFLASSAAQYLDVEALLWTPKPIITVPTLVHVTGSWYGHDFTSVLKTVYNRELLFRLLPNLTFAEFVSKPLKTHPKVTVTYLK